jgi:hypothetical protein
MLVNSVANLSHQFDLRVGVFCATRMTAAASAKAGPLGGFRQLKEAYLFTARPARGT